MTTDPQNPTLHLIDGHSLTFKAYYAVRHLTSPSGEPTGAVYGFLRMLLRFIDDYRPDHLAIVFDTGKPTFRKELYPQYKANREAPPPDFSRQMEWINQLLAAMRLPVYQLEGYEADDLIATMAERVKREGWQVVFLSADKDLFQLVDDRVTMLRPGTNDIQRFDAAAVHARLGIRPDQVIDWLTLVGDASDNVPGIPGIGEKTATRLLQEYGGLMQILERAHEIKRPKLREALLQYREQAMLARELVTVRRDVEFDWSPDACRVPDNPWTPEVVRLLVDLGFQSILKERQVETAPADLTPTGITSIEELDRNYEIISDAARLEAWAREALGAEWLALDTETTSTDAMLTDLVGISLCFRSRHAIYIPVGHDPSMSSVSQLELDTVRRILGPVLGGSGPRLVGHHAKFDWKVLKRAGFEIAPPAFDTMIASYLLDPDKQSGHGLKTLGMELLCIQMKPITELIGTGRNQITMAAVDIEQAGMYACLDADVTYCLCEQLRERLQKIEPLWKLMHEVDLPLIPVLIDVEMGGFRVDASVLREQGERLKVRMNELTEQIWECAGHPFNIGSPKQVGQVLFEKLKLTPGRKGKTGDYSTAESELERLCSEHRIARLILEFRAHEKLQSTYIDALPKLVHPATGRIHTSFNQTIAATGRLSSTDPNLQNIPIRTEMGRAIRRAFVADSADHLLLKADYSQIELRILAHVSGDAALRDAYSQGRDIHRETASEVFGVEPAEVTSQMRAEAKIINFGIIYGMSPHGLAAQLGISRQQAAQFIDRYFNAYPGVRAWIDRVLAEARRTGWVETMMGRRRLVPHLGEKNRMVREAAERIAVNTPIQGTCADMIKVAMIRIHKRLGEVAPGGRMVCQVHDELVFSLPAASIEPASRMIEHEMVHAQELDVPVRVEISTAPNWAEC